MNMKCYGKLHFVEPTGIFNCTHMFDNLFKKDVSNLNSVGQFIELYKQVTNAIKEQGADPDKTAKELINGNIIGKAVENYLVSKKQEAKKKLPFKTTHLEEIFHEKEIFIDSCGGTVESGFAHASSVYPGYLSSNVKDWSLETIQKETKRTKLKVFKMTKSADYEDLFLSINQDKKKMCMTQAQIIEFCKKHKDKLRKDGYGTFFLFEEDGKFFVARVDVDSGGLLGLGVDEFTRDGVWSAGGARHLVVPATALKSLDA